MKWVKVAEGREVLVPDDYEEPKSVAAPFVRNEHLSAKQRRALRIKLGRDFTSVSELRAHMRDNDLRHVEKGDAVDRASTLRREWIRDTKPGQRGRNPACGPKGYGGL